MSEVRVTWRELAMAANAGVTRRIRSLSNGYTERFDPSYGDRWGREIEGAGAELALAKLHNVYWSGHADTFRGPDVGEAWQVRHTERPDGCLIVHPEDDDEHVVWLVTGAAPVYQVRGRLRAGDAKQDRWLRDPGGFRPAYFVPQAELE